MMRNRRLRLGDRAAPARAAATLALLLSLASLTGWALDIQALTSIVPGAVEMKANTAAGLLFSAIALLILADRATVKLERAAQALSVTVLLLGAATLAEYLLDRSFGIDELLVNDRVGAYSGGFHGRMSPFTAAAFVAVALALIVLPHRRLRDAAKVGAAVAILIGATWLVGYVWNAGEIVTDRWLPPVALNTATCFALLGIGILLAPKRPTTRIDQQIAALAAVEVRILVGFILTLSLLLVGGSYTYRTTVKFAQSVEWIAHSQEVRAALASIYGSLAGSEVALRDYLLTKDDQNLAEYQRLVYDVRLRLADVERLTADNAVQQRNVADLRPIVMGRLAAMTSTLTAFNDFGLLAARVVIAATRQSNATPSVRTKIKAMDAEEVRLLDKRQRDTVNVRSTTLLSLLATLMVASGLFIALFRGVHKEMIARREAEKALRASDRYNRNVLESSPDCLCVLTLDGRVTEMTAHGRRLMDIEDFSSVEHSEWLTMWTGLDQATAAAALASARGGIDGRFQGFCPTLKGTSKWWDVIVMPIFDAEGKPERLLAVSRDITDVKKNEHELREANRFLDSLIENLPLMVVIKDAATLRIVRHNNAFQQLLGFSKDEPGGKTAYDLFSLQDADSISASDREALDARRLIDIAEHSIQTRHHGMRTFHTMKVPINDRSGEPRYLMAISIDITASKLAEHAIRELNTALVFKASELEMTNKELESFSYSVSHDLRAPLRAIDGFALMIEEDFSDKMDSEGRRYLAVIRENSRRMGALIDDLLSFSRLGRLPVATNDVNVESLVREVVEEITNDPNFMIDHKERIIPRIEVGSLPAVKGDRGLLRQVWVNLISNAIKYSSKSASPHIEVTGLQNGSETLYSVRDNGVGFNMEYAGKLFGVFQRLHRADEFSGTGVGLAIVQRVVTRHGGRVWAESKLNGGAMFSFALPKGEL